MVFDSIMSCDMDVRKDLMNNIVLSGGSTMFKGLPERLHNELQGLVHKKISRNFSIKNIKATEDRKYAVFKGAAILASLQSFPDNMMTR